MRALPVVLLLVAAAPARADSPALTAPPLRPPALTAPGVEAPAEAAPAEAPLAEAPPELPRTRYGYRLQIAATDAAAIGMSLVIDRISADGRARPGALSTLTIASYFFAAPMIHGVHRQGKRALASFALRAGLPLLFGLVGEQIDGPPPCDFCQDSLRSDGKVIGLTAGVLLAMAIDGGLLARPIYRRTERPRAAWAPALRGMRGGATAGLLGVF